MSLTLTIGVRGCKAAGVVTLLAMASSVGNVLIAVSAPIAISALSISPSTVQKHLERIHEKLGVGTRTAAAAKAIELSSQATAEPGTSR